MSVFYKGNKVASGGGTTNVTAHQFTNDVTDIKANASSGSLGVLDTIARADHVHPFSDVEIFADSEKEKSKNLFNKWGNLTFKNGTYGDSGTEYNAVNDEIFVKGDFAWSITPGQKLNVKKGKKYTVSGKLISSSALNGDGDHYARIVLCKNNFNDSNYLGYADVSYTGDAPSGGVSFSFTSVTIPQDVTYVWLILESFSKGGSVNVNNVAYFKDIQVEEGTVATAYSDYCQIVHQGEISGIEKTVTIYDINAIDPEINQGYTSGVVFEGTDSPTAYISNCTNSLYKGLYITLKINSGRYLRTYVPNYGDVNRYSFVGNENTTSNDTLIWGNGMWNYHRLYMLYIKQSVQTTTTVSSLENNSNYCVIKVEGVLK